MEIGRSTVIVGLGVDLLENRRIEQELERGEWLASEGIFTPAEIDRSRSSANPPMYFAACFAGKEAALKALGMPVGDLDCFREVEVRPGQTAEPQMIFNGRVREESERLGVRRIRFSVTQTRKLTGALVILET